MPAKKPAKGASEDDEPQPLPKRAWEVIKAGLLKYLEDETQDGEAERAVMEPLVPADLRADIQAVLDSYTSNTKKSYRSALVVQLGYGLAADEPMDLTQRPSGSRGATGVAGRTGSLLKEHHVATVPDSHQNIAKNNPNMARGNFPAFDNVLRWASEPERTKDELRAVFDYACCSIARTARPVSPMPDVDQGKLTFAAVMTLFNEMLEAKSGGAHEQYIVAALLEADAGQSATEQYVETKNINTSDKSARSPADVQLKRKGRVDEAFEVTANEWTEKTSPGSEKIRAFDLSRLHVVARVSDYTSMLKELGKQADDISVLEVRGFVATYAARLLRPWRAAALKRLYELLDRYGGNIELVNEYVRRLHRLGLAVPADEAEDEDGSD